MVSLIAIYGTKVVVSGMIGLWTTYKSYKVVTLTKEERKKLFGNKIS